MTSVKVAISLPQELFERMEAVADELSVPRSQMVAAALEEYLRQHRSRQITAQLDAVYGGEPDPEDQALLAAYRHHYRKVLDLMDEEPWPEKPT